MNTQNTFEMCEKLVSNYLRDGLFPIRKKNFSKFKKAWGSTNSRPNFLYLCGVYGNSYMLRKLILATCTLVTR